MSATPEKSTPEMDPSWQVCAVWVGRDGARTEQQLHFPNYLDARREAVRLSGRLGMVGHDDRALQGLEIRGDFWSVGSPTRAEPGWEEWIRP